MNIVSRTPFFCYNPPSGRRFLRALTTTVADAAPPPSRLPPPAAPAPVPARPVKAALCQLAVGSDKAANLEGARSAIRAAAAKGADLVVLPEMWNCPYDNAAFPVFAEDVDGGDARQAPSVALLAAAARESGVVLVGGSIPERDAAGRLYNTCLVFDRAGRRIAKHRKASDRIHLLLAPLPPSTARPPRLPPRKP